jgi:hypothetical protein
VSSEPFVWDLIRPELVQQFGVWLEPILGPSERQVVATQFAAAAMRRLTAVDGLFQNGYYRESHALVRSAYEDWLQLAYLLRDPGDERCEDFRVALHRHDARVYDAFLGLSGQEATERIFGAPPPEVAAFVGLPRTQTAPMSFTAMADDVKLRQVHDFVYTYLSGVSHPNPRTNELFDDSPSLPVARIPQRDPSEETRLALWFSWFTARIAVLSSNEFEVDRESFCDEYLLPIAAAADANLETCVFVREYGRE